MEGYGRHHDGGFTLTEMLVVTVVLGVLATVTVFAVRGITESASETACASELDSLETGQEVQFTLVGSYGDEATLLANGAIKAISTMYDTTGDASGYTITVAPGSKCTSGATGGSSNTMPPAPVVPPVVVMTNSDPLHGVPAWRYSDGDLGSAADQILVFGGAGGRADWVAADAADITTSRRTHFMDINAVSTAQVDTVLDAADNSGSTAVVVYASDDSGSIAAYIQSQIGNYNLMTYTSGTYGGGQLAALLAST